MPGLGPASSALTWPRLSPPPHPRPAPHPVPFLRFTVTPASGHSKAGPSVALQVIRLEPGNGLFSCIRWHIVKGSTPRSLSPGASAQGEMGPFCWLSKLWRNPIYCPKKGHTASPGNLADKALVRLLVTVRGPHCFQGLSWWAVTVVGTLLSPFCT